MRCDHKPYYQNSCGHTWIHGSSPHSHHSWSAIVTNAFMCFHIFISETRSSKCSVPIHTNQPKRYGLHILSVLHVLPKQPGPIKAGFSTLLACPLEALSMADRGWHMGTLTSPYTTITQPCVRHTFLLYTFLLVPSLNIFDGGQSLCCRLVSPCERSR